MFFEFMPCLPNYRNTAITSQSHNGCTCKLSPSKRNLSFLGARSFKWHETLPNSWFVHLVIISLCHSQFSGSTRLDATCHEQQFLGNKINVMRMKHIIELFGVYRVQCGLQSESRNI